MVLTGSRLLSNSSVVQVLALLSRFALAHLISDAFQTYLFYPYFVNWFFWGWINGVQAALGHQC